MTERGRQGSAELRLAPGIKPGGYEDEKQLVRESDPVFAGRCGGHGFRSRTGGGTDGPYAYDNVPAGRDNGPENASGHASQGSPRGDREVQGRRRGTSG